MKGAKCLGVAQCALARARTPTATTAGARHLRRRTGPAAVKVHLERELDCRPRPVSTQRLERRRGRTSLRSGGDKHNFRACSQDNPVAVAQASLVHEGAVPAGIFKPQHPTAFVRLEPEDTMTSTDACIVVNACLRGVKWRMEARGTNVQTLHSADRPTTTSLSVLVGA